MPSKVLYVHRRQILMVAKQLLLFLSLLGLLSLGYFQHIYVDEPKLDYSMKQDLIDTFSSESVADSLRSVHSTPVDSNDSESMKHKRIPVSLVNNIKNLSNKLKHIEIFGQVVDEYYQPVKNVRVSEDRNSYNNTRTDSNGQYRLTLELLKHKSPKLNFLYSGYKAEKVSIPTEDLKNTSEASLNVTLIESIESINVDGWIGNEIGENLSGQKIHIAFFGYRNQQPIYQTVISDEKGEFVFEAIKPDIDYKLEVYPTREYASYSIENLTVTRTQPRLNIILKALNFIRINGMFVDSEGVPVPEFEIDIKNLSTGRHTRKIAGDSSGFFSLENFPVGELEFSSKAPEFFRISGLTFAENEYRDLILKIDRGFHQIAGWVTDKNGVAIDRAKVTLSAEIMNDGIQSTSIRSIVTDRTGEFHFDQLSSVEHMLTIDSKGFNKIEQLHRFELPASALHISLSRK